MLPGRLDDAEREWHATQPPAIEPPVIIEHPIDPELQTGDSRKLGGAVQIKAPWLDQ
jgi:hypothetical protein